MKSSLVFFKIKYNMNTTMNTKYFKIKEWCPDEKAWTPSYYYIIQPSLPRTMGYMPQSVVDKLPTKKEVLYKVFRSKL